MASVFDSVQAFEQRVRELGLYDLWPELLVRKWTSFSVLAFVTDYVPGTSSADMFVSEVVKPLVGDDQPVMDRWKPLLKRLFVEAYTMAAHDIQTRADGPDLDEPRRMPNAEREFRLKTLQQRLEGMRLDGELQPSYHLIDLCSTMHEAGVTSYIGWEKCTKRDSEINGAKVERIWKPVSEGRIREVSKTSPSIADVGTDLLLKYALQRRGLALEIANICSFDAHSLWIEILFDALLASSPPGYARVNLNQLKRADTELWRLIATECRNGLKAALGAIPPFEVALKKLMYDPAVRLTLMPLPAASASSAGGQGQDKQDDKHSRGMKRRLQELEAENACLKRDKGKGKGNKSKDKGGKGLRVLQGKFKNTPAGEPICFNYNLNQGCPNALPGAKCARGMHVCAEPGCQKPHSLTEHR